MLISMIRYKSINLIFFPIYLVQSLFLFSTFFWIDYFFMILIYLLCRFYYFSVCFRVYFILLVSHSLPWSDLLPIHIWRKSLVIAHLLFLSSQHCVLLSYKLLLHMLCIPQHIVIVFALFSFKEIWIIKKKTASIFTYIVTISTALYSSLWIPISIWYLFPSVWRAFSNFPVVRVWWDVL